MELKKNPKVDLSKKRGLFFNVSLAFVLLLVNTAFEWRTASEYGLIDLSDIDSGNPQIELFDQSKELPLPPNSYAPEQEASPTKPLDTLSTEEEEEIMIEVRLDISLEGFGFDNSFLDRLTKKS
ncbi:MAG: hypothetical protein NW226_17900 [Microscillaceae bacterium]|nr:hypothetical protein [Microscillaceae bacterium]